MDMIWIVPDGGPAAPYNAAVATNMIAASLDPVAPDVWTTNHVLIPEAQRLRGRRIASMDPAGTEPGTFGHWLRLSPNEMLAAVFGFTMGENEMLVAMGE
jgi:hypothetical protein